MANELADGRASVSPRSRSAVRRADRAYPCLDRAGSVAVRSRRPGLTNRLVGFSSAADHGQALNGCRTDHRQQSQQLRIKKLLRSPQMQVWAIAFDSFVVEIGKGA